MKLSFKYIVPTTGNEKQIEIMNELMYNVAKVYNTLLYELKEGLRTINANNSINLISSPIYKEYRKNDKHSDYIHSHMLQEALINVIQDYKSYRKAQEEYTKDKSKFKGEPKEPRYKGTSYDIVFTKYAIRREKENALKLSISKKMQEKYQVESITLLIPKN